MCWRDFYGCDSEEREEQCRDSVFDMSKGTEAVFNPIGDGTQEIDFGPAFLDDVSTLLYYTSVILRNIKHTFVHRLALRDKLLLLYFPRACVVGLKHLPIVTCLS